MMISKFNKLIHNKIIWAVFAIIISLAMIGFFAPSGGDRNAAREPNSAGTLFGESVTRDAFNRARLFNQSFQNQRSNSIEDQERIREETWQRLAILASARQRGIVVTDRELSETIQRDPTFATNGAFDRRRYQQLIEGRMRIRVGTFEQYLREELMLRKMTALVGQSLWISPYELERSVARLTDLFTIQLVDIPYSNLVADVTADEDAIARFYEANPEAFEIPEERSVRYVEWPISNAVVLDDVDEESIQDYYDANLEDYAVSDTNSMDTTYTALEEVSDSIRQTLAWKTAIGVASEAAMLFTDDLSMMEDDTNVTFESVAKEHDVTVQISAPFSAGSDVPGLNVGQQFAEAAFRLKASPRDESYSHAIVAEEAIYVIATDETHDAHVPALDNVREQARALADDAAKAAAFEEKAGEIRHKLAAAAGSTNALVVEAEALGLGVTTPPPFSVYEASPEDMQDYASIAPAVLALDKGQVSEPIPTETGSVIISVVDRQSGDLALAESLKPDVARTMQSTRMRAHFASWAAGVLAEARGDDAEANADDNDAEDEDIMESEDNPA
ncbi:MAG: SurA N-terminal domain-containing protein [Verrucomicrobia bacterium]|jgi:peptidyl-prolyl cis-trans isomerase D|nr:SurA N-terminal domain-containing protein [Verrucomicrobiota bacterium]